MTKAQQILSDVARESEVPASWIKSRGPRSRTPRVVRARDKAMARIRFELAWSLPEIGGFFDRDHSSVHAAIARHRVRGVAE